MTHEQELEQELQEVKELLNRERDIPRDKDIPQMKVNIEFLLSENRQLKEELQEVKAQNTLLRQGREVAENEELQNVREEFAKLVTECLHWKSRFHEDNKKLNEETISLQSQLSQCQEELEKEKLNYSELSKVNSELCDQHIKWQECARWMALHIKYDSDYQILKNYPELAITKAMELYSKLTEAK